MSSNELAGTAPEADISAQLTAQLTAPSTAPLGPPDLPAPPAAEADTQAPTDESGTAADPESPTASAKPELSTAQCMALLVEHFPGLFVALPPPGTPHQGAAPKPLKLRIQADLQQRLPGVFTRKALSLTLHRYTTATPYLRALVQSPTRFDLDGQPAGELSDEHRQAAQTELDRRKALVAERRAAQRAAAPPEAPRSDRPRREGAPSRAPKPQGAGRSSLDDRAGRGERPGRPPRAASSERFEPSARAVQAPRSEPRDSAPAAVLPSDPAQRERAQLLRAWEGTALTKRNFCMLKGLSEADFDAQIAQAQQERGPRR